MKTLSSIIFILIFLSGCGTIKDKFCDYKFISPAEPMKIDQRLLLPCPDLVIPLTPLSPEQILVNSKENVAVYKACKNLHDSSVIVLKKISNNQ